MGFAPSCNWAPPRAQSEERGHGCQTSAPRCAFLTAAAIRSLLSLRCPVISPPSRCLGARHVPVSLARPRRRGPPHLEKGQEGSGLAGRAAWLGSMPCRNCGWAAPQCCVHSSRRRCAQRSELALFPNHTQQAPGGHVLTAAPHAACILSPHAADLALVRTVVTKRSNKRRCAGNRRARGGPPRLAVTPGHSLSRPRAAGVIVSEARRIRYEAPQHA